MCNTNNKAATVFSNFISAVNAHGLSLKVWGNRDVENVDVGWYMLTHKKGIAVLFLGQVVVIKKLSVYGETYILDAFAIILFFIISKMSNFIGIDDLNHMFNLHYVYRLASIGICNNKCTKF